MIMMFDPGAQAQNARDGDIIVSLNVGYNLSYREKSWVPVDVIVDNNMRDIEGYVQVECYGYEPSPQSPIYQLPAVSPKGSRKRFRLYCFLDGTTRVNARIYHNGRAADLSPAFLDLQPIDEKDRMAIVMDENATDYAFVNIALQQKGDTSRFYRDQIRADQIPLLAEHLPCYDPYNLIIMGDANPRAIPPQIQQLIARYVRNGGQLVVCLGENAPLYRGTWVEELAGVTIGEARIMSGTDLAAQVFASDAERAGASDGREGLVVSLTHGDDVEHLGGETVLMTRHTAGSGRVVTLAIDSSSKLLQDTAGYQKIWEELCTYKPRKMALNFAAAAENYTHMIGDASGIQLYSKQAVLNYLALYFLIGIVINGAVCYALKRRGMVWPVLIVVSLGFTSYAMIYGTAGRAKSNQWHQIDVAMLPPNSTTASVHTLASLLTSRTTNQTLTLNDPETLARDYTRFDMNYGLTMRGTRPFVFVQGNAPALQDFRVGASEVRPVVFEGEVTLPGELGGSWHSEDTTVVIEITNDANLDFGTMCLYQNGTLHSVMEKNGRLVRGSFGREFVSDEGMNRVYTRYLVALLEGHDPSGLHPYGVVTWEGQDTTGTYLIGVLKDTPARAVTLSRPVDKELGLSIVIMPLAHRNPANDIVSELSAGRIDLPVTLSLNEHFYPISEDEPFDDRLVRITGRQGYARRVGLNIDCPVPLKTLRDSRMVVDVFSRTSVVSQKDQKWVSGGQIIADLRLSPSYAFGPVLKDFYDPARITHVIDESSRNEMNHGHSRVNSEHRFRIEVDGSALQSVSGSLFQSWMEIYEASDTSVYVHAYIDYVPIEEEATSWQS